MMIHTRKINILDGLELKKATFRNKVFPTHFHDTYSIGIIKSGIENIEIKGNNFIATTNTVVVINQNELHANSFYNNESWTYETINLNIDIINYLGKKANQKTDCNFVFQNLIQDTQLYNLIADFHKAALVNQQQTATLTNYLLKNYLIKTSKETFSYPTWKNIIEEIKGLLSCNLFENINIEHIAKKYGKTPFQVIRAFKSHTGLTPIAYLTLVRLNKAKQLLLSGNTIVNTALECGFYDQSHFTKYFVKYFGITPKQYCNSFMEL